jgi:hypothetical protein
VGGGASQIYAITDADVYVLMFIVRVNVATVNGLCFRP